MEASTGTIPRATPVLAAVATVAGTLALAWTQPAKALVWTWSFERPAGLPHGPVLSSGLLHSTDSPDAAGFHTILSVSGSRNGVAITALLPTGSSIPGNAGYFSDNLLRRGLAGGGQLTTHGFNVSFADGSFSNLFTATFLSPVLDMDFHSVPPAFATLPDTELTGVFRARPVDVPAPLPAIGAACGLGWSRRLRRRRRAQRSSSRRS